MFLARQLYDGSRHGKLYADACIRKGFVQSEQELWTHPYCKPVPGWLNFEMWLEHLGNFNFTTLYAGEQMASECLTFPQLLKAAIKVIEDPIVRWVFEAQWDEESFHGMTGRYVVTKYCQSQLQQDEAAWAAQTTWRLLGTAADDLSNLSRKAKLRRVPRSKVIWRRSNLDSSTAERWMKVAISVRGSLVANQPHQGGKRMSNGLDMSDMINLFRKELALCGVKEGQTVAVLSEQGSNNDYATAFMSAAKHLGAHTYNVNVLSANVGLDAKFGNLGLNCLNGNRPAIEALKKADL